MEYATHKTEFNKIHTSIEKKEKATKNQFYNRIEKSTTS